ncbi:hypothetical protein RFI_07138 [Reticulomyxa filosa]|uniref:Uncharacterized protein n=1 Tax=Reticulomyxa filosa TaxID=46433 RepID=X6NVE9_RETFI|nr:hypothetical protein RFI_07138 [Reticulomyxa filosa]|eukprot:ETO29981.1 hypothetical protein RFI_07138 [Reticulomyxa filosa]
MADILASELEDEKDNVNYLLEWTEKFVVWDTSLIELLEFVPVNLSSIMSRYPEADTKKTRQQLDKLIQTLQHKQFKMGKDNIIEYTYVWFFKKPQPIEKKGTEHVSSDTTKKMESADASQVSDATVSGTKSNEKESQLSQTESIRSPQSRAPKAETDDEKILGHIIDKVTTLEKFLKQCDHGIILEYKGKSVYRSGKGDNVVKELADDSMSGKIVTIGALQGHCDDAHGWCLDWQSASFLPNSSSKETRNRACVYCGRSFEHVQDSPWLNGTSSKHGYTPRYLCGLCVVEAHLESTLE